MTSSKDDLHPQKMYIISLQRLTALLTPHFAIIFNHKSQKGNICYVVRKEKEK